MATVLSGGLVANAEGMYMANVRMEGGVVTAVGLEVSRDCDEVVDVTGKILLPGGVDAHTHFDLPLGDGTHTADCFATGTKAAISGGTTCVVDYATQFKGERLALGLKNWLGLAAGKSHCDYAFHMAITDWCGEVRDELPEMFNAGVSSFKMYMAYKGSLQVEDGAIYEAMKAMNKLGGLLCVHCENGDVIAARTEELLAEGKAGPAFHPVARPEELETEAVGRLLAIARVAKAPAYVVHTSAGASMRRIMEAKLAGQRVYMETCPQYLYLDDALYYRECGDPFEAAKYVCSPPLRGLKNLNELWVALGCNVADVVATDHCSFNYRGGKDRGRNDFTKIPNGMPGVETRMLLLYKGVADGWITLPQMVRLACANPAKIFGMYPRKGTISPGGDADIVVIDPDRESVIRAREQYRNVDYTPYEGYRIPCRIDSVYLRGDLLFQDGGFLSEKPRGMYVVRGPSGIEGV